MRLNVATSPELVREAVARIVTGIERIERGRGRGSMSEGTGEVHGPVDRMLLPYLERLRSAIPGASR